MAITTFAAVDIGSYETSISIYELSKKSGIKELNCLRYRLDLGRDAYTQGRIRQAYCDELCDVLNDFMQAMQEYGVTDYRACATSSLCELKNPQLFLDQIYQKTGMVVEILSNEEQRFLSYKSIAAMESDFQTIIQKGTAIIDVGGGSTQISLYDKDMLVSTQNLKLGVLRIREDLRRMEKETIHYNQLVSDIIHSDINSYRRMYLKDRKIDHVILLGDFFMETIFRGDTDNKFMDRETFNKRYKQIMDTPPEDLEDVLGIPAEYTSLVIPTIVLFKECIDTLGADTLWIPGTELADGIAYDFGEKNKVIRTSHNFDNDIVAATRNISKRYNSPKSHIQSVTEIAVVMFNALKRSYNMQPREKTLLQIAVQLHECGKYISMRNSSECVYNIVKSTEIIGLSDREREIVANVVKYNNHDFDFYPAMNRESAISENDYLIVARLTAILRVANELDRSHFQKIKDLNVAIRGKELVITVSSNTDMLLEQGLMRHKADFFEDIFNIRPVVRKKQVR